MAAGGVTGTGLAEMRRAVDRLPAAVEAAGRRVAQRTAERVAAGLRARVPVRSGDLKKTIAVRQDTRQYVISVGALTGPPIAMFLEYGTRYMAARPFFGPAMEAERGRYLRELTEDTAAAARGPRG